MYASGEGKGANSGFCEAISNGSLFARPEFIEKVYNGENCLEALGSLSNYSKFDPIS